MNQSAMGRKGHVTHIGDRKLHMKSSTDRSKLPPVPLVHKKRAAAQHEAQSGREQRRHGRTSVGEPHVPGGAMGSAAGGTTMRPSLCAIRGDQAAGSRHEVPLLDNKCQQQYTHSHHYRLCVAPMQLAKTTRSTVLSAPRVQRAPPLAHVLVVVVRRWAKSVFIHHASDVQLQACTACCTRARSYHSVRKCRDRCITC